MAESVTITTFLELKDNMSAGLKKVVAALEKLEAKQSGQTEAQKAQAKAQQEAAKAARRNAAWQKENERYAKAQERQEKARLRADAKATDFAAREARRRKLQAEKVAASELRSTQKAYAASVRAAERAEKQKAAAILREQRRVEVARLRAEKAQARQQKAQQREQARSKKEQADFVGKVGAAMFGRGVGGFAAAALASPLAGLKLGLLGLVDTIATGVVTAFSKAFDLTKTFFEKVYALNKEYQISIRRIAGSLVTMDFVPTFEIATNQAKKLYNTMRDLAAKLPGETKDYMEVFSLALPQALHAGEANLAKFTEKVSKFTAFAMFRKVSDINQVARDMERMIMGKSTGRTRMFNEYLAYMQMATNNLKFGVREFNQLSMPKRLELMYEVIEKSAETFGYMVNDADTLEGTFTTLVDQILTVGGQPLFDASLSILKQINKYLSDSNSQLTNTVKLISTGLGDSLRGAFSTVTDILSGFVSINAETLELVGITGDWADGILEVINNINKLRRIGEAQRKEEREAKLEEQRKQRAAFEATPGYQKMMAGRPATGFPGGVSVTIPDRPPQPAQPPATLRARTGIMGMFGAMEQFQPERPARPFTAEETRIPTFVRPGQEAAATKAIEKWAKSPAGRELLKGKDGRELWMHALKQAGMTTPESEEVASRWMREILGPRAMAGMEDEGGRRSRHTARKAPKERQTTINDFRYSKFDIKQEFAEGFDPDRIAVAFASDLSKLGEMRMQSAYAPLYTSR